MMALRVALQLFRPKRQSAAPDFTVPGLGGSPIRLVYRRFEVSGFTVLALSIDSRGKEVVAPFVKNVGLTVPVGLDSRSPCRAPHHAILPNTTKGAGR